jgi:hypothetical protein
VNEGSCQPSQIQLLDRFPRATSQWLRCDEETYEPAALIPILPYGEAHPVESHSEATNAGHASLFRILSTGVRNARLSPDYAPSEAALIVLQAVSNHGLETVIIFADFVHFLPLQVTGLHARSQMKRYTHRLTILAKKAEPTRVRLV